MEGASEDGCPSPDFPKYYSDDGGGVVLPSQVVNDRATLLEQRADQITFTPTSKLVLMNILDEVYDQLQPNQQDWDSRQSVIQFITNFVNRNIRGSCIRAMGSFVMDLFTSSSDLDFSLSFADGRCDHSHTDKVKYLRKVAMALYGLQNGQRQSVQNIVTIYRTQVPIVKFVECRTGIECDISVENNDGVLKSQILGMLVSTMDSRFRQLIYLVKGWVKQHNVNNSKNGTLNSLSICLLVAFHLQTCSPAILPPFSVFMEGLHRLSITSSLQIVQSCLMEYKERGFGKDNTETIPELFGSFFLKLLAVESLWGLGLCSSSYEGRWISKIWPKNHIGCISVEDFVDRTENVARSVSWKQFDRIYEVLQNTVSNLKDPIYDILGAKDLISYVFGSINHRHKCTNHSVPPLCIGTRERGNGSSELSNERQTNVPSPTIPPGAQQNRIEQQYRHNQRGRRHHHRGYRGWDWDYSSRYRKDDFPTNTSITSDPGYSGGDQYRHREVGFSPSDAETRGQYPEALSRGYGELVEPSQMNYAAAARRSRSHHATPSPVIPSGAHQNGKEQRYRHNQTGLRHHQPGSDR